MGVVDRGVTEGEDTSEDTGISLDLFREEFLILALNLLSMVSFRLRLEVLMGAERADKGTLWFIHELLPNVLFNLKTEK